MSETKHIIQDLSYRQPTTCWRTAWFNVSHLEAWKKTV